MFLILILQVAAREFFTTLSEEIQHNPKYFNGMKIAIIEPTTFKTPMLGNEAIVNGLKKSWNSTKQSVQLEYSNSFFDGLITFVRIWKFFEFFDFLTLNLDLSFVSDTILKALTAESPEKNYRVLTFLGRVTYSLCIRYLPQETIELFYQLAIYYTIFFSWKLAMMKKLINTVWKPHARKNTVK